MPRFANQDGGDEVWIESTPYPTKKGRRSSRGVDPKQVELGRKVAFVYLWKTGDYTQEELAKILNISRATVYRYADEVQRLLDSIFGESPTDSDDDWDEE
jgi:response regulator of citrate/malate metabolism